MKIKKDKKWDDRDDFGRYTPEKSLWRYVAPILVIAAIVTAVVRFSPNYGEAAEREPKQFITGAISNGEIPPIEKSDCVQITKGEGGYIGSWLCETDDATYQKWNESINEKIENLEAKLGEPKSILRRVCKNNGLVVDECARILYGMAWQESVFGKYMVGDGGQSKGWFHIMYYHNVPTSCSHDLECSSDWTVKRMMRFGFGESPEATKIAIMKHNGTPFIPATIAYFNAVTAKSKLWDK
jgi:hypothetical protein